VKHLGRPMEKVCYSKLGLSQAVIWMVVIAVSFIGVVPITGLIGLRFNLTRSLPIGVYVVTHRSQADLVEFCPEGNASLLSVARSYRFSGVCPDHAAPLLKPIAARPGDVVEVSRKGIAVNGSLLPNSTPQETDSAGRRLAAWPSGTYRVNTGTVWVVSSYNAHSFDSRYYGPISTASIRNYLAPLWTFAK
jgi:conjugative transfer signal peptidase TraF